MRQPILALTLATTLLGTGCYNHLLYDSLAVPEPSPVYARWQHHILLGLATVSAPVDVRELCPYGVAQAENYVTFANFLMTFFTMGIYAPSYLEVYCAVAKQVLTTTYPTTMPAQPPLPAVVVLPPPPPTTTTDDPNASVVIVRAFETP